VRTSLTVKYLLIINYYFSGGNIGNAFSINSSGAILTAIPLDRETKDQYELIISVKDRGMPPLGTTVKAMITVLDVNDNTPNITNTPREITMQENTPAGWLDYCLYYLL
jgi:hypothetical protein